MGVGVDPELRHRILTALGVLDAPGRRVLAAVVRATRYVERRDFNPDLHLHDPATGRFIDMPDLDGGEWAKTPGVLPSASIISVVQAALKGDRRVYWRFHSDDTPEFSPDNAFSAVWGSEFDPTGGRIHNPNHNPDRKALLEEQIQSGELDYWDEREAQQELDLMEPEWLDADQGYSAVDTAEELANYFYSHDGAPSAVPGKVVVFYGQRVGSGLDREPLVVPDEAIATMSWNEMEGGLEAGLWDPTIRFDN